MCSTTIYCIVMRSSIFTHGGLISRLDYWIFLFSFFPGVIDYKHLRDGLYIGSGMNGHMKAMRDIYRYYYYVLSGRGRQARCMEHSESWISLYNLNCFFWGGQVYISCCIKI